MTAELVLRGLGGVAPTQVLLDRGITKWQLARSVDEGTVARVRRGVLAVPDAEQDFVIAVSERARLTCISAARHYGLWCLAESDELLLSRPCAIGEACINHRSRSVPVHARLPLVGLVLEIDGAAFHYDRRAFRTDRRRNNMTVLGGYKVLRFCYEDVMYQPEEMLTMVLRALGRRPIR